VTPALIVGLEPAESASHLAPNATGGRDAWHATTLHPAHGAPSASVASIKGAAPPGSAPAVGAGAPGPSTATAVSAPSTAPSLPVSPAAETQDPSFDPATGYVEVGLINAQGVREGAIRAALRGVPLAACYRNALRSHGARATGVAQLSVSIDENGLTRSAIASGADFLPGLTRCVQRVAAGLSVPKARVDPGGATADVTLAFKTPP
jgi:hypothetical protein